MCSDVATPLSLGTTSFGTVTDFLQGAGQSQIVSQVCIFIIGHQYRCTIVKHKEKCEAYS